MKFISHRLQIKPVWIFLPVIAAFAILTQQIYLFKISNRRPILEQPSIEHLDNNQKTLLSQYTLIDTNPNYDTIAYKPRSFRKGLSLENEIITDPGIYEEWDVLNTPPTTKRLRLDFNRFLTMAVVWRENTPHPQWLDNWTKDKTVKINKKTFQVFKKIINDSTLEVSTEGSPILLFAELDGATSKVPSSPGGLTVPVPNQTCPEWVHEEYKAMAPDGMLYPTWHPQIDPVYWCYFNHEHGSNPLNFDQTYRIPFGYAGRAMGMNEAHVGYKVYVWDDNLGYLWLALQHQGTSTKQAACGNYHELDILAKEKETGKIVSEQYFVGDYGLSRTLSTLDILKPSDCPNQENINKDNVGVRFLPVKGYSTTLEEPWTVDNHGILGFNFANFTIDTYDPARECKDLTCDDVVYTGGTGTNRAISYTEGFGPKFNEEYSAIFYTDPLGKKNLNKYDEGSVRQYIKPGISISSDISHTASEEGSCRDIYGIVGIMECGKGLSSVSTARENSIKIPN